MIADLKKLREWFTNSDVVKFVNINPRKLDMKAVNIYLKQPRLLNTVLNWSVMADYTMLVELQSVKALVDTVQPIQKPIVTQKLYRAINHLTLKERFNPTKHSIEQLSKLKAGALLPMSIKTPLSFTTEAAIARRFGGLLVEVEVASVVTSFLRLTDELMYAVCAYNRMEPITQHEWIALPEVGQSVDVIAKVIHNRPGLYESW